MSAQGMEDRKVIICRAWQSPSPAIVTALAFAADYVDLICRFFLARTRSRKQADLDSIFAVFFRFLASLIPVTCLFW